MYRDRKTLTKTLSVRISLMVVSAIAVFLLSSLFVIIYYSQKILKDEALQEAKQTLESTVLQIDNILLSVEQASGNVYWDMLHHLDQPEQMLNYSRNLVESNPYIIGCAIAFEPYYYPQHGKYFMAYVHRSGEGGMATSQSPIIQASTFGNKPYNQQVWYCKPKSTRRAFWLDPIKEEGTADAESIITFSLPIFSNDDVVGVMGVDISLAQLSQIVEKAKASPNSYAVLVGSNGAYIVHPDKNKLFKEHIQKNAESPQIQSIGKEMLAGKTDYKSITINDHKALVFYKPFKRSVVPGRTMEDLRWSIAIVYPDSDIFHDYYMLLTIALLIAAGGLLVLFILSRVVTNRQILPLRHLAASVQRIADGNYDTLICDCHQSDEVGRLQDHFQKMQKALSSHVKELEQLTYSLQEQGRITREAYEQAKQADRMKTAFLHNMTNQMLEPSNVITASVNSLCDPDETKTTQQVEHLANEIQEQGQTITELLNQLLNQSRDDNSIITNQQQQS